MMERQPDMTPNPNSDLGGLSLSTIEGRATRQLHQLGDLGAMFAEKLPSPVLIKNPLPLPTAQAILITRWIGFGVVFPNVDGESLTGWITISHAMRANPGLTPSGTFSPDSWDKNIFTKRDHLLPRPVTIRDRAQATGAELAKQLLTRFPNRIDLSPSFDFELMDQAAIFELSAESLRPLTKEIYAGLTEFPLSKEDDVKTHQLIGDIASSLLRKLVIESALRTFTEERLRQAREDFERRRESSLIQKLIDGTSSVTTMVMAPLARQTLFKTPFNPPPAMELRQRCGVGLSISMAQQREYSELWKHLTQGERALIVTEVSRRSWSEAVRSYVMSN